MTVLGFARHFIGFLRFALAFLVLLLPGAALGGRVLGGIIIIIIATQRRNRPTMRVKHRRFEPQGCHILHAGTSDGAVSSSSVIAMSTWATRLSMGHTPLCGADLRLKMVLWLRFFDS